MGHFCLIWVFFCLLLVFFSRNYACYWCWFGCCCYCCFYAPSCLLNVLLLLFGCFLLLLLLLMLFLHVYVERIHIYWTNLFRKIICLNQEHMTAKPISTKQLLSWFRTNNYALLWSPRRKHIIATCPSVHPSDTFVEQIALKLLMGFKRNSVYR